MTTAGWQYKRLSDVSQVIAAVSRMQSVGAIAEAYQAIQVNHANYQYPNIATAHGCHRLRLEVAALVQVAGYQVGEQLVAYLLRQPSPDDRADVLESQVRDFSRQSGLSDLSSRFGRDLTGRPLTVELKYLKDVPRPQLMASLSRYEHQFFQAANQALTEVGQRELDGLSEALVTWLEARINRAGLVQTVAWLDRLADDLESRQQQVGRALAQTERQLRASQPDLGNWWAKLKQVSFKPGQDFRARHQARLTLKLQGAKLQAEQQVLAGFLGVVHAQQQALRGWLEALAQLAEQLQIDQTQYANQRVVERPVCVTSLLSPEQEEAQIARHLPAALAQGTEGLSFVWTGQDFILRCQGEEATQTGAQSLRTAAGRTILLNYAQSLFDDLGQLTIEQLLAQDQTRTAEEWLHELAYRAAPLVALDDAKQDPSPVESVIIATQHGAEGYFKAAPTQAN